MTDQDRIRELTQDVTALAQELDGVRQTLAQKIREKLEAEKNEQRAKLHASNCSDRAYAHAQARDNALEQLQEADAEILRLQADLEKALTCKPGVYLGPGSYEVHPMGEHAKLAYEIEQLKREIFFLKDKLAKSGAKNAELYEKWTKRGTEIHELEIKTAEQKQAQDLKYTSALTCINHLKEEIESLKKRPGFGPVILGPGIDLGPVNWNKEGWETRYHAEKTHRERLGKNNTELSRKCDKLTQELAKEKNRANIMELATTNLSRKLEDTTRQLEDQQAKTRFVQDQCKKAQDDLAISRNRLSQVVDKIEDGCMQEKSFWPPHELRGLLDWTK